MSVVWQPKVAELRSDSVGAFRVSEDLYLYLKRTALKQLMHDDPPWPVELGAAPKWEPDEVYIGHQRVVRGDWLVQGPSCLTVLSPTVFNKLYRLVE